MLLTRNPIKEYIRKYFTAEIAEKLKNEVDLCTRLWRMLRKNFAKRVVSDGNPIGFVQFLKRMGEVGAHIFSRIGSIIVTPFVFHSILLALFPCPKAVALRSW